MSLTLYIVRTILSGIVLSAFLELFCPGLLCLFTIFSTSGKTVKKIIEAVRVTVVVLLRMNNLHDRGVLRSKY